MGYFDLLLGFGIGIVTFLMLLVIGMYVLGSFAYVKALKYFYYDKVWMAWIPYAREYALAECTGEDDVEILPNVHVPMAVFKFWWVISIVFAFLPIPYALSLLLTVYNVICRGWVYCNVFEKTDGNDNKVLGYLAGWMTIIAVIKFLTLKPEN